MYTIVFSCTTTTRVRCTEGIGGCRKSIRVPIPQSSLDAELPQTGSEASAGREVSSTSRRPTTIMQLQVPIQDKDVVICAIATFVFRDSVKKLEKCRTNFSLGFETRGDQSVACSKAELHAPSGVWGHQQCGLFHKIARTPLHQSLRVPYISELLKRTIVLLSGSNSLFSCRMSRLDCSCAVEPCVFHTMKSDALVISFNACKSSIKNFFWGLRRAWWTTVSWPQNFPYTQR